MDTSERYIMMCQKAHEIQEQKPQGTDSRTYFYCRDHNRLLDYNNELGCQWCGNCDIGHSADYDNVVWLPRQDQLQTTMHIDIDGPYGGLVFDYLYKWQKAEFTVQPIKEYVRWIDSWEKLWLAFIMHARYTKSWDGTEWRYD